MTQLKFENKYEWNKHNAKVMKSLSKDEIITKDSKRQVNSFEKEIIWENSKIHPNFDQDIFRLDILGTPKQIYFGT